MFYFFTNKLTIYYKKNINEGLYAIIL